MFRIAAILALFALAIGGLVTYHPRDAAARSAQAAVPPMKADRVVVLKGDRKLILMRGESAFRVYNVALGRYPDGPKTAEGDGRTPEGRYVLDYRLPESAFHRAIHISYPNGDDVRRAQALGVNPGGQIMIHGLPKDWSARDLGHPGLNWTQGCIAVTNQEIEEILASVTDGTEIEILP